MSNPSADQGRGLRQQFDIEDLLLSDSRFSEVFIFSQAKGVAESDVDAALGAGRIRRPRGTEKPGLVLIVEQPTESPLVGTNAHPLAILRRIEVRIIEVAAINRASGGTQIDADTARDWVKSRLHDRPMGRASLLWAATTPWEDAKGGYGWSVIFVISDQIAYEERGAIPLATIANGLCTLTGAGTAGEVIYYTVDGSLPYPGGSSTFIYSAPFPVNSGQTVRAATVATGKELGGIREVIAP